MSGIHEPNVIDLVTHSAATGEIVMIMIEGRSWTDEPAQLDQLRDKINNYAMYVLDEGLVRSFPQWADEAVRIQLDCAEPPTREVQELIDIATARLHHYSIRFVVNVLNWSPTWH